MIGTLIIPITPILQERLLGYQRRLTKYEKIKIVMSENKIICVPPTIIDELFPYSMFCVDKLDIYIIIRSTLNHVYFIHSSI